MSNGFRRNRGLSRGRLETLTDGVVAIVITLLVIYIEPPPAHMTEDQLVAELIKLTPGFVAYVISFILLCLYWWRHHVIFHYLVRVDKTLMWINLLFLMCVALVPFPTALVTEYLGTKQEEIAVMIYGAIHLLCGLLLYAIWQYAAGKRRLIAEHVSTRVIVRTREALAFKPAVYAFSMVLSLLSIEVALLLYALIPLLHFLPRYREIHDVDLSAVAT